MGARTVCGVGKEEYGPSVHLGPTRQPSIYVLILRQPLAATNRSHKLPACRLPHPQNRRRLQRLRAENRQRRIRRDTRVGRPRPVADRHCRSGSLVSSAFRPSAVRTSLHRHLSQEPKRRLSSQRIHQDSRSTQTAQGQTQEITGSRPERHHQQ